MRHSSANPSGGGRAHGVRPIRPGRRAGVRGAVLAALLAATACSSPDAEEASEAGSAPAPAPEEAWAAEPSPGAAGPTGTRNQEPSAEAAYAAAGARGFPALRDLEGRTLADGDFAQWSEGDRLHVRIRYVFRDGREVDEQAAFRHAPDLRQESWSWSEVRDGQTVRSFEVDFRRGTASGEKHEEGDVTRWSEEVDVQPGQAFAGFGFSFAIQELRDRLLAGEAVEMDAVAFTPEPRVVTVELSYRGVERMQMAGRSLRGERFDIVPQIPWIAQLFVDAPDMHIWLTHPPPAEFLRFEGPLLEPEDPRVRIDLLPGGESGPAEPEGSPGGRGGAGP